MRASFSPTVKTITNINNTYFGALDVIAKILLGSKDLNIFKLYILKKDNLVFIIEIILIKNEGGVNNHKKLFNTLDQNMIIDNNYMCPSFELIVFEKRVN
jgi:hypothetical protein